MAKWRWIFRHKLYILVAAAFAALASFAIAFGLAVHHESLETNWWSTCESNLREVGQSMSLYTRDWDEHLPVASRWGDAIRSVTRYPETMFCPVKGKRNPYGFNANLSGSRLNTGDSSSLKVLLYESSSHGLFASGDKYDVCKPPRHVKGIGADAKSLNYFLMSDLGLHPAETAKEEQDIEAKF